MTKKILPLMLSILLIFFPVIGQVQAQEYQDTQVQAQESNLAKQVSTITDDKQEAINLGLTQEVRIINIDYHNEPITGYTIVVKDIQSGETQKFNLGENSTLTVYLANKEYSITEVDNHIKESIIDLKNKPENSILEVFTKTLPKPTPTPEVTETVKPSTTPEKPQSTTKKVPGDFSGTGAGAWTLVGGVGLVSAAIVLLLVKNKKNKDE